MRNNSRANESLVVEWRRKRGLTLLEMVFACGIFAVVALSTLFLYMTLVTSNNTTSMQVSGTNLVRENSEAVHTAARDSISRNEVAGLGPSAAALWFYASQDGAEVQGDRLIYHNPPKGSGGKFKTSNIKAEMGNAEARTTVTMYLKETTVPPPPSTASGTRAMWHDLGKGGESRKTGFDLNRDGVISDTGVPTVTSVDQLKDYASLENLGIHQLPVDITVAYYKPGDNDPGSSRPLFETTRRIIVTDESSLLGLDLGMKDPSDGEIADSGGGGDGGGGGGGETPEPDIPRPM